MSQIVCAVDWNDTRISCRFKNQHTIHEKQNDTKSLHTNKNLNQESTLPFWKLLSMTRQIRRCQQDCYGLAASASDRHSVKGNYLKAARPLSHSSRSVMKTRQDGWESRCKFTSSQNERRPIKITHGASSPSVDHISEIHLVHPVISSHQWRSLPPDYRRSKASIFTVTHWKINNRTSVFSGPDVSDPIVPSY